MANLNLPINYNSYRQAKITVQAKSEEELMLLQATAQSINVCARTIQDA